MLGFQLAGEGWTFAYVISCPLSSRWLRESELSFMCFFEALAKESARPAIHGAFTEVKGYFFPPSMSGQWYLHCVLHLNPFVSITLLVAGKDDGKEMPTKSDLKKSSFFMAFINTTWLSLIISSSFQTGLSVFDICYISVIIHKIREL